MRIAVQSRPYAPMCAVLTCSAVLLGIASVAWAGDSVVLRTGDDGEDVRARGCVISELTRAAISYSYENGAGDKQEATSAWADVSRWRFDHGVRPRAYQDAYDAYEGQEYGDAITLFADVIERCDARERRFTEMVKHYAQYLTCMAGHQQRNRAGAEVVIAGAAALERDFSDSYFMAEVLEAVGLAYQTLEQPDQALQAYGRLRALNDAPDAAKRGNLRIGLVHFNAGRHAQAITALNEAAAGEEDLTYQQARLFLARCYAERSSPDFNEAREIAETLVEIAQDRAILGAAYLVLGEADYADGDYFEAFMSFAKTATAFKTDVQPGERKRALGRATQCAKALSESNREDAGAWTERYEKLLRRYETLWPGDDLPA